MLQDGVPFTRAPQTAFEYSNFGYALLGRIVTNVSGRPYNDYIDIVIRSNVDDSGPSGASGPSGPTGGTRRAGI